jgi:hypothetical protein
MSPVATLLVTKVAAESTREPSVTEVFVPLEFSAGKGTFALSLLITANALEKVVLKTDIILFVIRKCSI